MALNITLKDKQGISKKKTTTPPVPVASTPKISFTGSSKGGGGTYTVTHTTDNQVDVNGNPVSIIRQGPMPTKEQLAYRSNYKAPAESSSGRSYSVLPESKTLRERNDGGGYTTEYGDKASTIQSQNPDYLSTRNMGLAKDFSTRGIFTVTDIFDELSKNSDFAGAPLVDRENTANEIAALITSQQTSEGFDAEAYAKSKGYITDGSQKQGTAEDDMLNQVIEQDIEKGQQNYLQEIAYSGTIYDRNKENAQIQADNAIKQINRALEKAQIDVSRSISDVEREASRDVQMGEFIGAMKGYNNSSGYVQGLKNIRDDANRLMTRMSDDFARMQTLSEEDKAQVLDELSINMKRATEDFQFQMRDVMDSAKVDMNMLLDKYGLSDDKLQQNLKSITADILLKRGQIINQYAVNASQNIANASSMLDMYGKSEEIKNIQNERFTSILNQDNGAALSSLSGPQIQAYVDQGYLTPQQGAAYFDLMVGKSINTLSTYGRPTKEDVDYLMSNIRRGATPGEVISELITKYPDRYMTHQERMDMAQLDLSRQELSEKYNDKDLANPFGQPSGGGQIRLNEEPVDTGIKNVYGSSVKLAPTVASMFKQAYNTLAAKGIELKIADSYVPASVKQASYEAGKPGNVDADNSFHVIGQAIDLSQATGDNMNNEVVFQALRDAGFEQLPGEWRHWSYGEMGGEPTAIEQTSGFEFDADIARQAFNGIRSLLKRLDRDNFTQDVANADGLDEQIGIMMNQLEHNILKGPQKADFTLTRESVGDAETMIETLEYYNSKYKTDFLNSTPDSMATFRQVLGEKAGFGSPDQQTKDKLAIKAMFSGAGAEKRNALFGASLTDNELKYSKPFIISGNDTMSVILAKLVAQKNMSQMELQRQMARFLNIPLSKSAMDKVLEQNQAMVDKARKAGGVASGTSTYPQSGVGSTSVDADIEALFN